MQLIDLYTHNFAYIGTRLNSKVDREHGDDETDLLWHGPGVGATYRFYYPSPLNQVFIDITTR